MRLTTILAAIIAFCAEPSSPSSYSLFYVQCTAACLNEFGDNPKPSMEISNGYRQRHCGDSCNAHEAACQFGCQRVQDLHRNFVASGGENEVRNGTSPITDIRMLCTTLDPQKGIVSGRFRIELANQPPANATYSQSAFVFLYEIRHTVNGYVSDATDWYSFGRNSKLFITRALPHSSHIQMRVFAVDVDGLVSEQAVQSEWIAIPKEFNQLLLPKAIRVISQSSNDHGDVSALISWQPQSILASCFYKLQWKSRNTLKTTIVEVDDKFVYEISSLNYDTNYTVTIAPTYSKDDYATKVPLTKTSFICMSCLQANRFNFKKCAPGPLRSAIAVNITSNASAIINWEPPEYRSSINPLTGYSFVWKSMNVSGHCAQHVNESYDTDSMVQSMKLTGLVENCLYVVGVAAKSSAGIGSFSWIQFEYETFDNTEKIAISLVYSEHSYNIIYWSIGICAGSGFFVIAFLVIFYYRNRRRRSFRRHRNSLILRSLGIGRLRQNALYSVKSHNELMEMGIRDFSKRIRIRSQVGEGTFGRVFKADCNANGMPNVVAVKILKDSQDIYAEAHMRQEIDLMKRLSDPHKNVVRFYGIYSEMDGFVMEYCPDGNLKQFLKGSALQKMITDDQDSVIDQTILLSYGRQICTGVQFLHDQHLVHRDLAARNVLVTDCGETVKISDFGLCRVTHVGEYRVVNSSAVLPLKWMAPESIQYGAFSCKSDVWSFGVLLWELITIGGDPYHGVSPSDLFERINKGYRLPKPLDCSNTVYAVMRSCWSASPDYRPTFGELFLDICALLCCSSDYLIPKSIC